MIRIILLLTLPLLVTSCTLGISDTPWIETSIDVSPVTRSDYDSSVDAQLATLTNQVSKRLTGLGYKDIAVLSIVNLRGKEGKFEKYLRDEMVNRLSKNGKFRVFTANSLLTGNEEDREENDSLTEKILSKLKGESVYLTGKTANLSNAVKFSIQITSIDSGQILGTSSILFKKNDTLLKLMGRKVDNLTRTKTNRHGFSDNKTGRVLKVTDNDYIELIHDAYTLYIKRINYKYSLFEDEDGSTVEIFINDDFRIMSAGDMVNLSYGSHQFVLSLHRVLDRRALFTFASLSHKFNLENFEAFESF